MTITKNFTFDLDTNYTYDPLKIEFVGGLVSLLDQGGGVHATDNPTVTFNDTLELDALQAFTESAVKSGLDEVKYTLTRNSVEYYYNSGWIVSDGTYAQSNTAVEIETNKATFTATGIETIVKMFLHSEDGTSTPIVSNVAVAYNFVPVEETVRQTILWWYSKQTDASDTITSATIALTNEVVKYGDETTIIKTDTTITPTEGLFQISLLDTENMNLDLSSNEQTYTLTIGSETFTIRIPAVDQVNLYDDGVII
jgi:hypothetical protein